MPLDPMRPPQARELAGHFAIRLSTTLGRCRRTVRSSIQRIGPLFRDNHQSGDAGPTNAHKQMYAAAIFQPRSRLATTSSIFAMPASVIWPDKPITTATPTV